MTQALVQLSKNANRVLNIVKAKYNLNDKSKAIELVIKHYIECLGDLEMQPEFIERINKAEKGKFIKINDFAKHYDGN